MKGSSMEKMEKQMSYIVTQEAQLKQQKREPEVQLREIVVLKGDERNNAQWKIGSISQEKQQCESSQIVSWKIMIGKSNTKTVPVRVTISYYSIFRQW